MQQCHHLLPSLRLQQRQHTSCRLPQQLRSIKASLGLLLLWHSVRLLSAESALYDGPSLVSGSSIAAQSIGTG